MLRRKRRPSPPPQDAPEKDAARQALREASEGLEEATYRLTRAEEIAREAHEIRDRNHFAEKIFQAYRRIE